MGRSAPAASGAFGVIRLVGGGLWGAGWRCCRSRCGVRFCAGRCGGRRRRCAGLSRCVFAGAFGLQIISVEDAVAAIGADSESLRVVFEGVGRRLGSLVRDIEETAAGGFGRVALVLVEDEVYVSSLGHDGAGLDEALDAEIAVVSLVSHAAELGDGDVVALIGAVAGICQPANGAEDYGDGNADAGALIGRLHGTPALTIRGLGAGVNKAGVRDQGSGVRKTCGASI